MSQSAIFYPVFAQVALTFVLMFWTGRVRIAAVNTRAVKLKDIALGQKAWPDHAMSVSNSFNSQFEMPMLFYAVVVLAVITGNVTQTLIALAWVFVVTRVAHVAIYTSSNNLRHRLAVFALGAVAVMVMWIILALRIIWGGA